MDGTDRRFRPQPAPVHPHGRDRRRRLAIGIGCPPRGARAATVATQPWDDDNGYAPHEIDAWIAIDPDDAC